MQAWTSLVGWLGAVAVVFGLLSFLLVLFSGSPFLGTDLWWILGNFVVGVALLVAALASNLDALRERLRSEEARRAGKYGTSAVLSTALAIALLALLAFLSTRYYSRWDFTEAQAHSLSQQSLQVLEGLERDVEVTAFYPPVGGMEARDLLERYTFRSDRFQVEFVDPQAQPGRVREFEIPEAKLEGGVLRIALGEEAVLVDEVNEQRVTNALVQLSRQERKKVYFLTGHGERPLEGEGADGAQGFAFASEALANENYGVERLLLAAQGDVPEDADVLVAAGPTRPFHESELRALERYVERGGALLVLVDPRAQTNLYERLGEWGVSVGEDVVVDRVKGLYGRPATPFSSAYGDHPVTEPLRDDTLFHMARSVSPRSGADGAFTELVRTSEDSWAEHDLELFFGKGRAEFGEDDRDGPVAVAVAGTLPLGGGDAGAEAAQGEGEAPPEDAPRARLVVVGDSDFATNQLVGEFANRDFFVNAVNWLLGDVEAISIRPERARATRLQLTGEQFLQIRYLSLFVLPEAIAAIGVFAWWSRRRAPGR